ncbi:hypothetical protein NT6N_15840 [Oceaniferula spumae]|uniref:Ice-binding protein C-terminal domain-containing protein n=1 Tax=Oceaniferula spumae TaxID=2979115 RepID=A0AAT9FKR4_9BACT
MKINHKLLALIASGAAASAASAATITADLSDAEATSSGGSGAGGNQTILAGVFYSGGPGLTPVFAFQLPTLAAGETFDSATVTLSLDRFSGTPAFNSDLIGLTRIDASPAILGTDWNGPGTLLHDDFLTPASSLGANTSNDFTSWLITQYDGGANAGQFIFIQADSAGLTTGGTVGYHLDTANNVTVANRPVLNYTTVVPEPSSAALLGLGGLTLIMRRRK